MELIHLGMNDPTSIYGNFTFYLVKYGEPEFDTILKFVGEVPDKHDYLPLMVIMRSIVLMKSFSYLNTFTVRTNVNFYVFTMH